MAKIKTEKQYKATCARIEELLKVVGNDTPADDKNFLELDLISDLVADYEEEHFPVKAPSLVEVIKHRIVHPVLSVSQQFSHIIRTFSKSRLSRLCLYSTFLLCNLSEIYCR